MNIENLKKLEAHLRSLQDDHNPKVGFSMNFFISFNARDFWGHECKTVCCIGGHAAYLKDGLLKEGNLSKIAQEFLELTYSEANDLFYPHIINWKVTPNQAADAVKRLMDGLPAWG